MDGDKVNSSLLEELMSLPSETEWLEFKEAKQGLNFDEIGQYFSALSNEANVAGRSCGWLIFGVTDRRPRQICGTGYRAEAPGLEKLKFQIAQRTNHRMTFSQIYEVLIGSKRVIMFEIPAAPAGVPTTWNNSPYGRVHQSLGYLAINKMDAIRNQVARPDWSAAVCPDATMNDLDSEAIQFAREQYKSKQPHASVEVAAWSDEEFLNKSKITLNGRITRAAVLLLGKPESTHFLSPATAKITWLLRDERGNTQDYAHFVPPFVLAVDRLFEKVRNLTYRYMSPGSLFPIEVTRYDTWVLREALHNCIAHQDYAAGGQVTVIEDEESVQFCNRGTFIPVSVERALRHNAPAEFYRNRFLSDAMVNLKMIDTVGSGMRKMFVRQQERFFPMPDYDLSGPSEVKVSILGRILDEKYSFALMSRTDLDIFDVIALDKVQRGKANLLSTAELNSLRRQGLIEGRRTNLRVSAMVASATETVVNYLKRRGIDKAYCRNMVLELLERQGQATRQEFEDLLLRKLSDGLDDGQKRKFIDNLLQEMRREGVIMPGKRGRGALWVRQSYSPKAE